MIQAHIINNKNFDLININQVIEGEYIYDILDIKATSEIILDNINNNYLNQIVSIRNETGEIIIEGIINEIDVVENKIYVVNLLNLLNTEGAWWNFSKSIVDTLYDFTKNYYIDNSDPNSRISYLELRKQAKAGTIYQQNISDKPFKLIKLNEYISELFIDNECLFANTFLDLKNKKLVVEFKEQKASEYTKFLIDEKVQELSIEQEKQEYNQVEFINQETGAFLKKYMITTDGEIITDINNPKRLFPTINKNVEIDINSSEPIDYNKLASEELAITMFNHNISFLFNKKSKMIDYVNDIYIGNKLDIYYKQFKYKSIISGISYYTDNNYIKLKLGSLRHKK